MIGPGGAAGAAVASGRLRAKTAIVGDVGGSGTYPNEPAGMTTLAQWDGSSKTLSGWSDNFHATRVTVEDDGTEPLGNGKVLRFLYEVGDSSCGVNDRSTFTGGPFSEMYVMYRIKYETGWELLGHKNFFGGMDTGSRNNTSSPTQWYATFEPGHAARVATQNVGSVVLLNMSNAWDGDVGSWVDLEIHCVAESSPAASDGEVYYWHDNTLLGSATDVQWVAADDPSTDFDGFQWYTNRNDSNTVESAFRVAELYISGK